MACGLWSLRHSFPQDRRQLRLVFSMDEPPLKLTSEGDVTVHNTDDVFYNPAQVFNRDLSVLAISTYVDALKKEGPPLLS